MWRRFPQFPPFFPGLPGVLAWLAGACLVTADLPEARFRAQTIDDRIALGYGVAVADVDGDGKPDVLVADKEETVWYQNPEWTKRRLVGKLTQLDNVSLAAANMDGRPWVVVGANWNPNDTLGAGALFVAHPGEDRLQAWATEEVPREPTAHRMYWARDAEQRPYFAVLPLHGRGNVNSEGEGIVFAGYRPDGAGAWEKFLIHKGWHEAHNFDPVTWEGAQGSAFLIAAKEGVHLLRKQAGNWQARRMTEPFAGEVRLGRMPGGKRFLATIEPRHGHQVVINPESEGLWSEQRLVVERGLKQGHALAVADFLGVGYDQVVAGWRERNAEGKVGLRMYAPDPANGGAWKCHAVIDDNGMACEDLRVADLNGDGKPDLVASGNFTKNVVIYWNERE